MVAVEHQRSISKEENEPNDEEPKTTILEEST